MILKALKKPINSNIATDDFIETVTKVVKRLLKAEPELFESNSSPRDIYLFIQDELGPWTSTAQRAAALATALVPLASLEASFRWNEGKDPNNHSTDPSTWEAGIFQESANSMVWSPALKSLAKSRGVTDTYSFRRITMSDHEFAVEYAIRLFRVTVATNGPLVRKEINSYLNKAMVTEFLALLAAEDTSTTVHIDPIPGGYTEGDFKNISTLQHVLNQVGHYGLVEDGINGPKTTTAVKEFQKTKGLDADGEVGPLTTAALNKALAGDVLTKPSETPWIDIARQEIGVHETEPGSTARILEYDKATTLKATDNDTPWCSAFVSWCLEKALYDSTKSAWAQSYALYGTKLDGPKIGCIVPFRWSASSGHVGFCVGFGSNYVDILGGNQSDPNSGGRVSIARFGLANVMGYRWPVK